MVPMLRCLFCKRKRRLFRISTVYGRTGCPIKNYIIEFLGPCEQYLHDDHGICSACVFLLNKLLYIRKCMHSIIAVGRDEYNNTSHFKFSYVYKHFIENLQKLNYEEYEAEIDQNVSELLMPVHSSPWEETHEAEYNAAFGYRYGTPYADREIQNAFSGRTRVRSRGRGRRRGNNWTRRKSTGSRSRFSTYSEPLLREDRRISVVNYSEYYNSERSDSDEENDQEVATSFANSVRYDNRMFNNKRTSSVDEQDGEVMRRVPTKYKCINGCPLEFYDLAELTKHKVEDHGLLAKYICYECYSTKFVSPEDLKLHNDLYHHTLISNCLLCSIELRTIEELQKHLAEHRNYSYPCGYCDMFFLSYKSCSAHIAECHKGKKKKIKKISQHTIKNRIYRSDKTTAVNNLESKYKYDGQIIWRLQRGPNVKKLSVLCIDVIKRFYQGTLDILSLTKNSSNNVLSNKENQPAMEISDYANEPYLDVQNEVNVVECTNKDPTGSDQYDNTDVYASEEMQSPAMNVETSEPTGAIPTSVENEAVDQYFSIPNDSFENFVTINNVKTSVYEENDSNSKSFDEECNRKSRHEKETDSEKVLNNRQLKIDKFSNYEAKDS